MEEVKKNVTSPDSPVFKQNQNNTTNFIHSNQSQENARAAGLLNLKVSQDYGIFQNKNNKVQPLPKTNDNNPYNEELNHSAVAIIGDIVTTNAK